MITKNAKTNPTLYLIRNCIFKYQVPLVCKFMLNFPWDEMAAFVEICIYLRGKCLAQQQTRLLQLTLLWIVNEQSEEVAVHDNCQLPWHVFSNYASGLILHWHFYLHSFFLQSWYYNTQYNYNSGRCVQIKYFSLNMAGSSANTNDSI